MVKHLLQVFVVKYFLACLAKIKNCLLHLIKFFAISSDTYPIFTILFSSLISNFVDT